MEIWKGIKGLEGLYEISDLGRVKSLKRFHDYNHHTTKKAHKRFSEEKILKHTFNKSCGYYYITLHKDKKVKTFSIHRLIAIHFIPNPKNLPFINHKNGLKLDNSIENLEWITPKGNSRHASDIGLIHKGERHYNTPLTKEDVIYIRKSSKSNQELGKEFGFDYRSIWQIRNYITWKHI